jgi:hypothetical protein
MNDLWAFGWTQLLTIVGFVITVVIARAGFRTFERWHREKIEEKRIDTAVEALALVYESKLVFEHIRSEGTQPHEWKDMPEDYGEARAPFYAILRRIRAHKEFFDRAWKVQVKCTALFGSSIEDTFSLLHDARAGVQSAAQMLLNSPKPEYESKENLDTWERFRADVWSAQGAFAKGGDQVGQKLTEFRTRMEALCRPIIDRNYGKLPRKRLAERIRDMLSRTA